MFTRVKTTTTSKPQASLAGSDKMLHYTTHALTANGRADRASSAYAGLWFASMSTDAGSVAVNASFCGPARDWLHLRHRTLCEADFGISKGAAYWRAMSRAIVRISAGVSAGTKHWERKRNE